MTAAQTDTLRGIVTVLNTPFTTHDALDLAGLRRNVANAIEAGVAGFLTPALASEVAHLSDAEKRTLVATVVAESRGRAVVIGGASAETQQERLQLTHDYLELDCDGVLVQLNPHTDPRSMDHQLFEIARLGPGFLMLQDWDPEGPGIPLPTLVHLCARIERLTWLKVEVQQAGPKYSQVLDTLGGTLRVAGGWAVTQMIDGLDRGVHVFMPTAMHRIYVEIYRRYARHDRPGAEELFARIRPVLAFTNQHLDVSIRFFKRLLHAQGVFATPDVRIEGARFDAEQARTADCLIETVIQIEDELS